MKYILIIILAIVTLTCSKKSEKTEPMDQVPAGTVSEAPQMGKQKNLAENSKLSDADESGEEEKDGIRGGEKQDKGKLKREEKKEEGIIEKPLDPISDASKSRLLEYTIQLNYKVESIEKAREGLLNVIKKESYIAQSQTNLSSGYENMYLQVQIPVSAMYDTLLQMDKIGQLTYEDIRTQDWTEHNELQKIKLTREGLRMIRRSKAANKGSAETWNWKDREDALERSEDTADNAKLESWKIKDHVAWAKVNINISGKELPTKLRLPNYKDAIVNAVNFLLEITYYIALLIPIAIIGYLIFRGYKWIRR